MNRPIQDVLETLQLRIRASNLYTSNQFGHVTLTTSNDVFPRLSFHVHLSRAVKAGFEVAFVRDGSRYRASVTVHTHEMRATIEEVVAQHALVGDMIALASIIQLATHEFSIPINEETESCSPS